MISQADALQLAGGRDSTVEGEAAGEHYHYFNREDEAPAWLAQRP